MPGLPARYITCPDCGEYGKHYAKGLCKRCWNRQYRKANRERRLEYNRQWYADHREQACEYQRRWGRAHREQKAAWNLRWRKAHEEEWREYMCGWRSSHRDIVRASSRVAGHRYSARKAKLPATLTTEEWQEILEEYGYKCAYCGAMGITLQQEHKTPVSRGGGYAKENIVPACSVCNQRKRTKTYQEFVGANKIQSSMEEVPCYAGEGRDHPEAMGGVEPGGFVQAVA